MYRRKSACVRADVLEGANVSQLLEQHGLVLGMRSAAELLEEQLDDLPHCHAPQLLADGVNVGDAGVAIAGAAARALAPETTPTYILSRDRHSGSRIALQ